jgi:hypothetical protein
VRLCTLAAHYSPPSFPTTTSLFNGSHVCPTQHGVVCACVNACRRFPGHTKHVWGCVHAPIYAGAGSLPSIPCVIILTNNTRLFGTLRSSIHPSKDER